MRWPFACGGRSVVTAEAVRSNRAVVDGFDLQPCGRRYVVTRIARGCCWNMACGFIVAITAYRASQLKVVDQNGGSPRDHIMASVAKIAGHDMAGSLELGSGNAGLRVMAGYAGACHFVVVHEFQRAPGCGQMACAAILRCWRMHPRSLLCFRRSTHAMALLAGASYLCMVHLTDGCPRRRRWRMACDAVG